ncbi:Set3 complex subunit with deacetylase activity, meiotic-specific repressor of sporulation proteins [Lambiella insularis]|nr:Set3 complex subunit with deacetylase activity, meiotic-specific repressor of sporulation proteins [Lambiella insularis]
MNDVSATISDTTIVEPESAEVKSGGDCQDVLIPPEDTTTSSAVLESGRTDEPSADTLVADQRSDSEAETVVLSGKDDAFNHANPKAIKHEGNSDEAVSRPQDSPDNPSEDIKKDDDKITALDRRKDDRDFNTANAIVDTSYSSNLSSTASSPAPEERSLSEPASEVDRDRSSHPRKSEWHTSDGVSRKRKSRTEDTEEKGQQRRQKRAISSETANQAERRDTRKASNARSESPHPRPRNRAQSTQSLEPHGGVKRRKPPPLQVSQRAKFTEETNVDSDDSGSANGPPRLRKPLLTDNAAMSPAKPPHKKHRDKNGRTWLARACAVEDLETAIERLKERPEDLDAADNAGNTPLQIASLEGNAAIVKMLLDAGCDTACWNIDKDTPLIDAVENGHLDVIKLLLKAGLDPHQSNAKGEEPVELLDPDDTNYEEIKAALVEAKGRFTGRRASEEQHGQASAGKDGASVNSPRASPSLHSARSPPPHGLAPRRTARSEATRNDLLYMNATPENLRKSAGKGDIAAVDHILNMRPMGDIESVLMAARGGHDNVVSHLIAMGSPIHDPNPLDGFKPGFDTPMLAAIGRGNLKVISLLLDQPDFDPTRRLYENLTYHEIVKDRGGLNWQEEYSLLKDAYDAHRSRKAKGGTHSKARNGFSQRDAKNTRQDNSPLSPSVKRQSPDSASKDLHVKRKRLSETGQGQKQSEGISTKARDRSRLHVPSKEDSRESSVIVSDREVTPLPRPNEKARSSSDAGHSGHKEREASKPKKRLVSRTIFKEDEEKKRRASLASSSSSQDQVRKRTGAMVDSTDRQGQDHKDTAKINPPEAVKKRPYKSISPSEDVDSRHLAGSDKPQKIKRQRVNSTGKVLDRSSPGPPQLGPARVANMIPASRVIGTPSQSQGAAPVAFMGTSNASPIKESTNTSTHASRSASPKAESESNVSDSTPSDGPQATSAVEKQITLRHELTQEELDIAKQNNAQAALELQEQQKREQELIDLAAKEKAARDEAERITRKAEEARLQEQRQIEEAEHKAQLEREAEQALVEKKRQEEEAQRKLAEKERLRKEDLERRRAEQEERERTMRIRRQEEEERRRRESLPNALRILAELSPDEARDRSEILRWLPLYTAFGHQLDSACDEQARNERWITNLQAAPVLAISDLALTQYTAWTKLPVNESHRFSLWRVLRLKLARFEQPFGEKYDIEADFAMDEETRIKYIALENIFWIRLSEFLDIVPRYPHLANISLTLAPLGLPKSDPQANGAQSNTASPTGPRHTPMTNGHLTNGYH